MLLRTLKDKHTNQQAQPSNTGKQLKYGLGANFKYIQAYDTFTFTFTQIIYRRQFYSIFLLFIFFRNKMQIGTSRTKCSEWVHTGSHF